MNKGRRPSLKHSKGSSSELNSSRQEKLPELKTKHSKKLDLLGATASKVHKAEAFEEKDIMYTTAPNFNNIKKRQSFTKDHSRSK